MAGKSTGHVIRIDLTLDITRMFHFIFLPVQKNRKQAQIARSTKTN